ncbi:nodulation-signaling pathway 2 protein [Cinnamomum micranthum f. kanehirae]|uniref:Nodulation-signaling pathway 2 protein n=1 Tax=Cinnamomum micranthum f. kanehirae TaxID=337451 RepID=A0A3S3MM61_9MAGN|nr:nodulation-signaling pathway 2 protein [Cinnamomum micranthum f. kanehirae]
MFNPQFIQPTWLEYNLMHPYPNEANPHGLDLDMVANMGNLEFSSSLTTTEDYSDISSSIPYFPAIYPEELPFNSMSMTVYSGGAHVVSPIEDYSMGLDELAHVSNDELFNCGIDDVCGWIGENWEDIPLPTHSISEEESTISSMKSGDVSFGEIAALQPKVIGDEQGTDADNEVRILHLLKAYGEAIGMESIELGEVILQRIRNKVGPVGATMKRLGHYLSQCDNHQNDYLVQEARKNYEKAFRAFYDICPYGRFAHFRANMAILEAIPEDVQTVHIIDFDMGEGVQWPPLLEALGRHRMVRLTSLIQREDQVNNPLLQFKVTKRRLSDYARSQGLSLKIEEMDMEKLLIEKRRMKKRGGGKEWMAFNCMVSLPHMQMQRSRKDAWEFIRAGKELLNVSNTCSSTPRHKGVITFGCGGDGVQLKKGGDGGFGFFFDRCLLHLHALFESVEWHFPPQLSLARTAMECLFVEPYVSSVACFSKWEESHGMHLGEELEGWRLSRENFEEAKEMVRGENLYEVRIDGEMENEMVLAWRGTPLVRVSIWK